MHRLAPDSAQPDVYDHDIQKFNNNLSRWLSICFLLSHGGLYVHALLQKTIFHLAIPNNFKYNTKHGDHYCVWKYNLRNHITRIFFCNPIAKICNCHNRLQMLCYSLHVLYLIYYLCQCGFLTNQFRIFIILIVWITLITFVPVKKNILTIYWVVRYVYSHNAKSIINIGLLHVITNTNTECARVYTSNMRCKCL